ncbi:unnamed protein product [Meganyctiphanes norvegica]|uniref:Uncharacterized protein n=1 Tax=Meganyctiphanes norvegica TaxID=48144 RepID=A0AAV2QX67_MEGNR
MVISENYDYRIFGSKRRKLSDADANNRARFERRNAIGVSQGVGVSPGNALADPRRKGPRRLYKNPKPQEEEDVDISYTKRTLQKSISYWMTWMEHELCEYLHQNEWDSYKTESLKLIIEYKNKSERRRREDLQAHQQHSQRQHGAGPSGWEPMNSQQHFQPLSQNLSPQPPPQAAISPPRLSPEDSNIITHICHALSTAHGAPIDTNVSIKQEPGLNTSHGTGINIPQEFGLNTSEGSGINTTEGSETNAYVITISHPPNETANGAEWSNRAEGSKEAKWSKGAKGSSKKE